MSGTSSRPGAPSKYSRRQALKVLAATLAVPVGIAGLSRLGEQPSFQTWQGESLGGPASLTLWHPNAAFAHSTIARMRSEVERLEGVFSLFRHDSEISRLNHNGRLLTPSPDLVAVLEAAREIAAASHGAFDPTVQPLWRVYSEHFRKQPELVAGPPAAIIEAARALVDYRQLEIGPRQLRFAKPGMAVTLNGIAQGYITDRIADLLQQEGFDNSMVDVGETRAIGGRPEGGAWLIALKNPRNTLEINRTISIANEALAVSGGYGQHFPGSDLHHIFDPASGRSAQRLLEVSVVAPRAMLADALSTAIFVSGEAAAQPLLALYPETRAMLTRRDGTSA
ncbi:FAD:protein FMN transferase [Devosia sp. A369]